MGGKYAHSEAERHVNGRNHPLEDDDAQHDPQSLGLFLYENITADPAKREVDA